MQKTPAYEDKTDSHKTGGQKPRSEQTGKAQGEGSEEDSLLDHPADPEEEAQNTEATIHVDEDDTAKRGEAERTVEEVRQGHTGDHVRYILLYSLIGIVAVMAISYLFFLR